MGPVPLNYAWVGVLAASFSFLIHVSIWRLFPKRRTFASLLGVFVLLPLMISLLALPYCPNPLDLFAPTTLACLLGANYMAAYPAIQAKSPSLKILLLLKHHTKGLSLEQILDTFRKEDLFHRRVQELIQSKLIAAQPQGYQLRPKGAFLAFLFVSYRKVLRLPLGEG